MGITAFKFAIWGGKSAVLQSQITFKSSAEEFPTVKLPIYLPKWQIWMLLSPNSSFINNLPEVFVEVFVAVVVGIVISVDSVVVSMDTRWTKVQIHYVIPLQWKKW